MKDSSESGHVPRRGRKAMTAFFAALDDASGVSAASDIVFDRVHTNLGGDFESATVRIRHACVFHNRDNELLELE